MIRISQSGFGVGNKNTIFKINSTDRRGQDRTLSILVLYNPLENRIGWKRVLLSDNCPECSTDTETPHIMRHEFRICVLHGSGLEHVNHPRLKVHKLNFSLRNPSSENSWNTVLCSLLVCLYSPYLTLRNPYLCLAWSEINWRVKRCVQFDKA